ncbi:phosphotransferase [Brevibacterium luteolum]|uniref:phosphotransferase n=1 Tax=Brevibacterium luteolum TaxID=199591 RepID=UPI0014047393|nr:phosphotransferase [Brevibacterium luteolum]
MDTLGLRLAAIAAGQIAGFEPSLWTKLPDSRGPRVLLSDEDRSLVVSLIPDSDVPAAQTEAVACAVLRSLLPDTQIGFPQILASVQAPDDLTEDERTYEVQISDPLAGTPATLEDFAESQQLVSSLADFLADLHNSDTGAVADAGLVVHDSAELREQLLADLDRAAGTGLVPAVLLQRWEDALENVSTWRFLPCPIHAALAPEAIRVEDGRITSVSDFFRFRVGDPAADLAAVSTFVEGSHYEHFLDRYRQQRDIKDAGLQARAELLAELAVLDWLLLAVDTEDEAAKSDAVALLNSLAEVATADAEQPRHAQPYEFTDRGETRADDPAAPKMRPLQLSLQRIPLQTMSPATPHLLRPRLICSRGSNRRCSAAATPMRSVRQLLPHLLTRARQPMCRLSASWTSTNNRRRPKIAPRSPDHHLRAQAGRRALTRS